MLRVLLHVGIVCVVFDVLTVFMAFGLMFNDIGPAEKIDPRKLYQAFVLTFPLANFLIGLIVILGSKTESFYSFKHTIVVLLLNAAFALSALMYYVIVADTLAAAIFFSSGLIGYFLGVAVQLAGRFIFRAITQRSV